MLKLPLVLLALLIGALSWGLFAGETPRLSASAAMRADVDDDGLSDVQEEVLGTSPDDDDTDDDGYSDLEELARRSDPTDILSVPQAAEIQMGVFASTLDGTLNFSSAVYVAGATGLEDLSWDLGIVVDGVRLLLDPDLYQSTTYGSLRGTKNPSDVIILFDTSIPEYLVGAIGTVSVFGLVTDNSPAGQRNTVDVETFTDFSGTTMSIEDSPAAIGGGVIYRPLAGDDDVPVSWTSGQVCWQNAVAAGVNGSSIIYEIEAASCEPLDGYCSPGSCAQGVGTVLELPDPGALLGG